MMELERSVDQLLSLLSDAPCVESLNEGCRLHIDLCGSFATLGIVDCLL
jgi:hypothetical protein